MPIKQIGGYNVYRIQDKRNEENLNNIRRKAYMISGEREGISEILN
jgi:hypothetical protein